MARLRDALQRMQDRRAVKAETRVYRAIDRANTLRANQNHQLGAVGQRLQGMRRGRIENNARRALTASLKTAAAFTKQGNAGNIDPAAYRQHLISEYRKLRVVARTGRAVTQRAEAVAGRIAHNRQQRTSQTAQTAQIRMRAMKHAQIDSNHFDLNHNNRRHFQPDRPNVATHTGQAVKRGVEVATYATAVGLAKAGRVASEGSIRGAQTAGMLPNRTQPAPGNRQGPGLGMFRGGSAAGILRSIKHGVSLKRLGQGMFNLRGNRQSINTPHQDRNRYQAQGKQAQAEPQQSPQTAKQQQAQKQQSQSQAKPSQAKGISHER